MTAVENLLVLYGGVILLNALLAAFLWGTHRTELNRRLFFVWGASVLSIVAQAVGSGNDLLIVTGFAPVLLVNLMLAYLIASITEVRVPLAASISALIVAYALSVVAFLSGASFLWVALPVSLAVATPVVGVAVPIIRGKWSTITFSVKALIISSLLFAAHNVDFAFLRDKEQFAALGFTIAIVIIFGLSVFAPAVVLEVVTDQQSRTAAEMDVAHRIQMAILPKHPEIPGLELSCYMRPADKVGGDYYDVYSFGEHHWILLGDVTGHGLRSGLVMLMAQSILSAILHTRPDITPRDLAFLANGVLYENLQRLNELRTMTLVALHRTGGHNRWVYSGSHDNIYVLRAATGKVDIIDISHLPHGLGFLDEFGREAFTEDDFELAAGDLLFIASDGIVEAARGGVYGRGMFEEDRLVQLLTEHGGEPVEAFRKRLLTTLDAFTKGVIHDDVTFVMARVTA